MEELKRRGFTDPTMRDWTFENDNGREPADRACPPVCGALGRYADRQYRLPVLGRRRHRQKLPCRLYRKRPHGERNPRPHDELCSYPHDLAASFEGRNEYISRLCRYPLLILDDFGMERGTEYGLEQVFNVIDSRYPRSGKPLIVTTNLTLDDLHNPEDTAHSRIYDRLLSMCVPVRFTGDNFRQETAKRKMESMKKLITD